jgi:hypothetical protein
MPGEELKLVVQRICLPTDYRCKRLKRMSLQLPERDRRQLVLMCCQLTGSALREPFFSLLTGLVNNRLGIYKDTFASFLKAPVVGCE